VTNECSLLPWCPAAGGPRVRPCGTTRALQMFCTFPTDARYGRAEECDRRFGEAPVQICHEWNTVAHLAEYEGSRDGRC
jgi:integrase/recombinase XerC